jgi:hypothetical protein
MPPAHVFLEDDWEIPQQPQDEEWEIQAFDWREMAQPPTVVREDWDSELLVPAQGRLVYVGQGQSHFAHFHQPTPGLLWPKRKRKKRGKKKGTREPPPEPAPESAPAPIDWDDWDERCQTSPHWQPEDWELEISPPWEPDDLRLPVGARGLGCRDCCIPIKPALFRA